MYSFSRSTRFREPKKEELKEASFYDLPTTFSKRTSSFGIGTRPQIFEAHRAQTPDPASYKLPQEFEVKPGTGWSFGISRKAYEHVYFPGMVPSKNRDNPGPGAYKHRQRIGAEGLKFSLKYKFPSEMVKKSSKFVPGPGAYDPKDSLNSTGSYFFSKMRSTAAPKISPLKSRTGRQRDNSSSPGPNHYRVTDEMNLSGRYFLSKFRSSQGPSFGKPAKKSRFETDRPVTPGPGSYESYSEFNGVSGGYPTMRRRSHSSFQHYNRSQEAKPSNHSMAITSGAAFENHAEDKKYTSKEE